MEIKATLKAPYTEEQKVEFIIEQNHQKGYEIRGEQPETLVAWGYTKEEIAEQEKEYKVSELKAQLDQLDLKSIRAIRANDEEYITKYEKEAEEIRKQIKELEG